ncbi:hypothetical protein H0H92_015677, partial [Tricholoma furcatifolium]
SSISDTSSGSKRQHYSTSKSVFSYACRRYFTSEALSALSTSPEVDSISEDGVVYTTDIVTQTNAPWGLSRLSAQSPVVGDVFGLNYSYAYDSSAGSGSNIYIIDTGIMTTHNQFVDRARWGAAFGGYSSADGNGHGTHCAGIAAGTDYGVAKLANLIAVKVLSDAGSGSIIDIISGIEWVCNDSRQSGQNSVASMSFGGVFNPALNRAVENLISDCGVHAVVAAGNSATLAALYSPASAEGTITVGASNINDEWATYSNYGLDVALFAPGSNITSSYIGNPDAIPPTSADSNLSKSTKVLSGTSMATPHVAGLVAYLMSLQGNTSPKDMRDTVRNLAQQDALGKMPLATENLLAQNGLTAGDDV